ncbi:hypothetical protein DSO57_1007792 [Entomophthora muscae]|uniref:Uncharacterized protein n=1 Tax=Entomophthora muscae TaxID=34485 RepID=A0ACC2RM08_9FUNG|nr:hypothetical protein DSO57_1007792 [Entomophthora muscae]
MRSALIITWLLLPLEAAVFFTNGGGLSIFPAVTKGIHASSKAAGKVVEDPSPARPEHPCRLARRGRRRKGHGMKRQARRRNPSQRRTSSRRTQRNKEKNSFTHDHESNNLPSHKASLHFYMDEEASEIDPLPTSANMTFTEQYC